MGLLGTQANERLVLSGLLGMLPLAAGSAMRCAVWKGWRGGGSKKEAA